MLLGGITSPAQSGQSGTETSNSGVDSQFADLVRKLMGGISEETDAEVSGAGQQLSSDDNAQKSDNKEGQTTDAIAQASLLLGSSGVPQEMQNIQSPVVNNTPVTIESGKQSGESTVQLTSNESSQMKTEIPAESKGDATTKSESLSVEVEAKVATDSETKTVQQDNSGDKTPKSSQVDDTLVTDVQANATEQSPVITPAVDQKVSQPVANNATAQKSEVKDLIRKADVETRLPGESLTSSNPVTTMITDAQVIVENLDNVVGSIDAKASYGSAKKDSTIPTESKNDTSESKSDSDVKAVPGKGEPLGLDMSYLSGGHGRARLAANQVINQAAESTGKITQRIGGSKANFESIEDIFAAKSKIQIDSSMQSKSKDSSASNGNAANGFVMPFVTEKAPEPTPMPSVNGAAMQPEAVVDRTISTRMINQIVKSAKVHLSQTGGDMVLRLDPPHLGTVQMNVTVEHGIVTATLQTSTEQARDVLQADLGTLKQTLSQSGINVDQINVSVGTNTSQNSQQFSGNNGWMNNHRGGYNHRSSGRPGTNDVSVPIDAVQMASAAAYRQSTTSQLNYLA